MAYQKAETNTKNWILKKLRTSSPSALTTAEIQKNVSTIKVARKSQVTSVHSLFTPQIAEQIFLFLSAGF
jgi:hypothetical protein